MWLFLARRSSVTKDLNKPDDITRYIQYRVYVKRSDDQPDRSLKLSESRLTQLLDREWTACAESMPLNQPMPYPKFYFFYLTWDYLLIRDSSKWGLQIQAPKF